MKKRRLLFVINTYEKNWSMVWKNKKAADKDPPQHIEEKPLKDVESCCNSGINIIR